VTRTIRVLRVIARLNVGGPARHVTILDGGLRARGFETLLAHGDVGAGEASLERLIPTTGIRSLRIAGLGRSISLLGDVRAFLALVRLIFRYQPDVVHTHTAKAGTLGRIGAWLYNVTRLREQRCLVVHTFHGHVLHGYFGTLGSRLVRAIERALGWLTDIILVLSPRQRQDIGERYRIVPLRRMRVVPLGLELDELMRLPLGAHAAGERVVFGFVGRFVAIKNLPLLVDAFAAVHREEPATRLVLVGDGEGRSGVETAIAGHGLETAVELAGWRDDLVELYRSIDVLVLTSLNEGTPVAVIEAMAAGLPVIATDVGGVGDVVTHDDTGVLVPSQDTGALASAMLRVVRHPDDRRRLGAAARESVRSRFTADRLVAELAALYRGELDLKRHGRRAGTRLDAETGG
jgi:glycosyltransferase involved in cell wall biosynthesis